MKLSKKSSEILSVCNENKLFILKLLYTCRNNICGCDLVSEIKIPKNLVSYHIKTLRDGGFIEETRCGKNKNYQIAPIKLKKVEQILKTIELI